jgi:hypothetical protein
LEIERKHDTLKGNDENKGVNTYYYNMLSKLDHAVELEVKEERKAKGDCYEDADLGENGKIHCTNFNFKTKIDANGNIKIRKVDNYMDDALRTVKQLEKKLKEEMSNGDRIY